MKEITVLAPYQTHLGDYLEDDEIFVREEEDGQWWVMSWDGREAWTLGDAEPTDQAAIMAAREAIEAK